MCQSKADGGLRCSAHLSKARRENLARTEQSLIEAAVVEAAEPAGDSRAWQEKLEALRQRLFSLASERARLDDEWAATPAGQRDAALAAKPGTVEHARDLALRLHAEQDQRDRLGVPYEFHLRAVAAGVDGQDEDTRIAAWLHDSIEDVAGVDAQFLRSEGVPDRAVEVIEACTHADDEDYADAISRVIEAGPRAQALKRSDLAHNTRPDRVAALLAVGTARARQRAVAAGRDPDTAAADVARSSARRIAKYAEAIRRVDEALARG